MSEKNEVLILVERLAFREGRKEDEGRKRVAKSPLGWPVSPALICWLIAAVRARSFDSPDGSRDGK